MDLEGHPVFRELELGPDPVENSISDVAKRSVEVVKDEQFEVHVFLFHDNDLTIARVRPGYTKPNLLPL